MQFGPYCKAKQLVLVFAAQRSSRRKAQTASQPPAKGEADSLLRRLSCNREAWLLLADACSTAAGTYLKVNPRTSKLKTNDFADWLIYITFATRMHFCEVQLRTLPRAKQTEKQTLYEDFDYEATDSRGRSSPAQLLHGQEVPR